MKNAKRGVLAEHIVPISQVARIICPTRPPHLSTVWRWILHGVGGQCLATWKCGRFRYTSLERIEAFRRACNANNAGDPRAMGIQPTPAAEAAAERLKAIHC